MDDMFMKYGMIIVGVAVIAILLAFAWKSLGGTDFPPKDINQEISANSAAAEYALRRLCAFCLGEGSIDRDCYIVRLELTSGNLSTEKFVSPLALDTNITPGNHILKIANLGSRCEVRLLE